MFSARVLLYELQHQCVTRSSVTNNNTNEKKNIFENEHKSLTLCVQFAKLLIRQEFAIVLKVCVCVCTNMWKTRKMLPKKIKNSLENGVIIVNFHWQIK